MLLRNDTSWIPFMSLLVLVENGFSNMNSLLYTFMELVSISQWVLSAQHFSTETIKVGRFMLYTISERGNSNSSKNSYLISFRNNLTAKASQGISHSHLFQLLLHSTHPSYKSQSHPSSNHPIYHSSTHNCPALYPHPSHPQRYKKLPNAR